MTDSDSFSAPSPPPPPPSSPPPSSPSRLPSLPVSLLPLLFLILGLGACVYFFGSDATGGPVQIALVFSTAFAGLVAHYFGVSWKQLQEGIKRNVTASFSAILILLLIGPLAGTWMLSGVVPTIIYYGLQVFNPTIFLFATCITTAVIALATGSSWSTIATVGVAFLGIGKALAIPEGLIGGAIISGAYFGDKLSPMSDTTNLAPAVAGTNLFVHIRYMLYTTIPSMALALLLFLGIGLFSENTSPLDDSLPNVLAVLDSYFVISPWLLLVPLSVIFLILRRVEAAPALLVGTIAGIVIALLVQPERVADVGRNSLEKGSPYFFGIMKALYTQVDYSTSNAMINGLLTTRGMAGMLNTIWLIICALSFGGSMESAGFLKRIAQEIIKWSKKTASLIASTTGTCIFFNATAGDQYLSIVVSGKMFAKTYKDRNLKPEVLSRTLEDSGTVTSVLIPWNTCGATQSAVLGINTLVYAPYCFFNLFSPVFTILFAVFNLKIRRITEDNPAPKQLPQEEEEEEAPPTLP